MSPCHAQIKDDNVDLETFLFTGLDLVAMYQTNLVQHGKVIYQSGIFKTTLFFQIKKFTNEDFSHKFSLHTDSNLTILNCAAQYFLDNNDNRNGS
jgi:hypothetical protein